MITLINYNHHDMDIRHQMMHYILTFCLLQNSGSRSTFQSLSPNNILALTVLPSNINLNFCVSQICPVEWKL